MNNKVANMSVLCMAMVVGIHVVRTQTPGSFMRWFDLLTHYGIFLIAVPFFFACSGYFLARHTGEKKWWAIACKKRFVSLLVPYLLWSVIAILIPFLLQLVSNVIRGRFILSEIKSHLLEVPWLESFGLDLFSFPQMVTLWYVRVLIIFVAVSPVIVWTIKKYGVVALACLWLLWAVVSCVPCNVRMEVLFRNSISVFGLFWFSTGFYIALHRNKASRYEEWLVDKRWTLCVLGVCTVVLSCFLALWTKSVPRVKWLEPIFVPVLLGGVWAFMQNSSWPKWLTKTTFQVFLLHLIIWRIISPMWDFPVANLLDWIIKFAVGFFGSIAVALILKRMFPRCSAILFGGRG